MSVMTTIVDHKNKKMLTLGKQWWGQFLKGNEKDRWMILDESYLLECVARTLCHGGSSVKYALYMRDLIRNFVLDADGEIEVLTDSEDGARLWQLEKKEGYTDTLCTHVSSEEIENHITENY